MALASQQLLFDEVLEFLASTPTKEMIIDFKPSDELQARASRLLDKNRQGNLSPDEERELDEFQRMNHFVSMLKARVRQKLKANE